MKIGARRFTVLGLSTLAVVLATSGEAEAQPATAAQRDQARSLVYVGREKRDAGAYAEALEAFKRAHALMNVPTTGLELAKTQVAAGQLLEARTLLTESLRAPATANEPAAFAKAKAEMRTLLDSLVARVPNVTIDAPHAARVTLDGEPVSAENLRAAIAVNPGQHEIVARQGDLERRRTVTLTEGGSETVRLSFPPPEATRVMLMPPPASEPATQTNPLVYVGGALLIAGAATGAITGGMTLSARSSVEDRCAAAGCPPEIDGDIERGKTLGTVSTVAFAVAGAGAVMLVYGLLVPSERRKPTVGLRGASFTF